jgi:hypothetical protein
MIDAEVLRLRNLRSMALRTRALAKFLDSDCTQEQSIFARSAVMCWTIARVASGHLRAHPYMSYQRGPTPLGDLADSIIGSFVALTARRRNRRFSVYAQQLRNVAREVDDARALTWSPDLSDALGRMQVRMQRLANELELSAVGEIGASVSQRAKLVTRVDTGNSLDEIAADTSWPYLAI